MRGRVTLRDVAERAGASTAAKATSLPAGGPLKDSTTLYRATIPPAIVHSTTATRSAPSTSWSHLSGSMVVARAGSAANAVRTIVARKLDASVRARGRESLRC